MRWMLALLLLLISSRPVFAQVPGCAGGVLSDPRAYVFATLGRTLGAPAGDWEAVLQNSGIPATSSVPGTIPPATAPFYGITQWKGSAGNVRGRLSLPTAAPDENGYYTHSIDVLEGPAESLRWAWRDVGGPPYAPRPCAGTVPPPPPSDALAELAAKLEALTLRVEQLERNPPRVLLEDTLRKALQAVQFNCEIGRTGPGFLSHGHPCSVTVK